MSLSVGKQKVKIKEKIVEFSDKVKILNNDKKKRHYTMEYA